MAGETTVWPAREDDGVSSQGPLAGLRVVDLTTSYAGPTASMYLADLGADVIKVERPRGGDDARGWGPPFVDGTSAWFASANRNKRSLTLDLGSPAGLRTLQALIASADVFMQNLNPGKLERLGMSPDVVRAANPRLIYCAMSGFGLNGPAHSLPGYDLAVQARSGLMSVTGAKGGSPQRVSTALSDVVTGMCAALAVSAAAVQQRSTGAGEVIDVSLLDSDLALMAPRIAAYLAGEAEPTPSGGTDSVLAVYQSFETADRPVVIAIGNDAMWLRFCAAVGQLDDLASNEALADNAGRRAHRDLITERVEARMRTRSAQEWLGVMAASDVPCSVVQSLSEVVTDPQVLARGSLLPVPGADGLYSVHSPFRLRSISEPRNEPSPALGEHTEEVLRGMGLDWDEIADAAPQGSVGAAGRAAPERASHG